MLHGTADALVLANGLEYEHKHYESKAVSEAEQRLPSTRFKPGLLFFLPSDGTILKNYSTMEKDLRGIPDEASMLGLSVSALRELTLSSGSWVCISTSQ